MGFAFADHGSPGAMFLIEHGGQLIKPNPGGSGQTPVWEYPSEWTIGGVGDVVYFAPFRGANIWGTYRGGPSYRGGTFELCGWPSVEDPGWPYHGVPVLAIEPNWAGVCPTGDVVTDSSDRKSDRRKAEFGDLIAFEFENPGQVADSRARYRLVPPSARGYWWLLRCHNVLHDLGLFDGRAA